MDQRIVVLAVTVISLGFGAIAAAPTAAACDVEFGCTLIDAIDETDTFLRECLVELHEKLGM